MTTSLQLLKFQIIHYLIHITLLKKLFFLFVFNCSLFFCFRFISFVTFLASKPVETTTIYSTFRDIDIKLLVRVYCQDKLMQNKRGSLLQHFFKNQTHTLFFTIQYKFHVPQKLILNQRLRILNVPHTSFNGNQNMKYYQNISGNVKISIKNVFGYIF